MIALHTYPTFIEAAGFQKGMENDSFSHRVWVLHGIIADPASDVGDVKNAKRSLLRILGKPRLFERSGGHYNESSRSMSYCRDVAEQHRRRRLRTLTPFAHIRGSTVTYPPENPSRPKKRTSNRTKEWARKPR